MSQSSLAPVVEVLPPAPGDIVRKFLSLSQRVDASGRADAASALARAYLYSDLDAAARRDAALGMTALLDDPSLLVRRALAEALAGSLDAPHHIILALASDHSEVASIVLARSPVLSDAEMVDCAAIGDAQAQCALAQRARLPAGVCAALAEVGRLEANVTLADNGEAQIPPQALQRMMQRFAGDAQLREAILLRGDLPVVVHSDLIAAAASDLTQFAVRCGWLSKERAERTARDAREQGFTIIAAGSDVAALGDFVHHLRMTGGLTIALLMRALLCADAEFFTAGIAELTGVGGDRIAGFLRDPNGRGFASAYGRSGLSPHYLTAFRAALSALRSLRLPRSDDVSRALVQRVIAECETSDPIGLAKMLGLLRRFDAEAARREAREFALEVAEASGAVRMTRIAPTLIARYEAPPIDFALLEAELASVSEIELPLDRLEALNQAA